jgi:L-iditol 2-dehydrogenase
MRALQLIQPRSFVSVDVPTPELNPTQNDRLLIKTSTVSMCGSDIPKFSGSKRYLRYPLPPGAPIHECAGEVVESTSEFFAAGDLVVAMPDNDQGLAEHFIAYAARSVRLPLDLASCDTCSIIQPLSTVMHALDRVGTIEGRSFAIVGLGSIGLLFCWLLKKRGADDIVGIDPIETRCQIALEVGANRVHAMRGIEVVHAARRNQTDWEAPKVCIEAVGHQMDTLNDCLELVQRYGTVIAFGVPDHEVYAIEYETFFRKNAHLIAAVTPNWDEYLQRACDLFVEHRQELETMVTHRFPILEAGRAFELYEGHNEGIVKAVLDCSTWS